MYLSNFDIDTLSEKAILAGKQKLKKYRDVVKKVIEDNDSTKSEYSLVHARNPLVHDTIDTLKKRFKGVEHLILVGIGGSSLGTEAVHKVLDRGLVKLHTLDTVSAYNLDKLLGELKRVSSVKKIVICVVSKSGDTVETLVNAGVLLDSLGKRFKKDIYKQTLFIGNPDTDFLRQGKKMGVTTVSMPEIVGGRYSVATEVSLIPLALLGHDTDAFIAGFLDASQGEFEPVVMEDAIRVHHYLQKGFSHYNFFAFEMRLATLGAWYRQLFAESLGKALDRNKKPVTKGFLPTISTPVELHSVGQLYLSGFSGVYTDFVTFDDELIDFKIPKQGIVKKYAGRTMQEVITALYGGVVGAYQEQKLPYRSTIFTEDLPYSLGLFMGMRMLETMYVAELMNLNAFDQPNVELYKVKTKNILGL